MKFLVKIYILLIVSLISLGDMDVRDMTLPNVDCNNGAEIIDKEFSDYKECVLKSVFEKPCLNRTSTCFSSTASVRTVNSLKKIGNNLSIINAVKCFCVKKHLLLCKISSEDHSLYDTDIFYLVLRHIII